MTLNTGADDITAKQKTDGKATAVPLWKNPDGSFEEDNQAEEMNELSWRLDPEESLSDWTIEIQREDNGEIESYHVHKCMLAVGPRQSQYFSALMRGKRFAESMSNTSKIVLPAHTADVFPAYLDFAYSQNGSLKVTAENAVPLRSLASYFGVVLLRKKVLDFISKDVGCCSASPQKRKMIEKWVERIVIYYSHAVALKDDRVLSMLATAVASNIEALPKDSKLLREMDPGFLLKVMSNGPAEGRNNWIGRRLATVLVSYFSFHTEEIDDSMFLELTNEQLLPEIAHDAAFSLLKIEADICAGSTDGGLTSLQQRCVDAIAKEWSNATTSEKCRDLPDNLARALLCKVLEVARGDYDAFRSRTQAQHDRELAELKAQLEETKRKAGQKRANRLIQQNYSLQAQMWQQRHHPV